MSIADHIQNATKNMSVSGAKIDIKLGNGHSNISATGNDVNIDTGCGNQTINVIATGDANIDTGHCGEDTINAVVGGNFTAVTREDDDTVVAVVGGNFNVDVGEETHECEDAGYEWTDNDTVKIMCSSTEGENYLNLGKGADNVALVAHNVTIDKGYGDGPNDENTLLLGAIGHNYTVNSFADQNIVGAWGDNYEYNFYNTESFNEVNTLDFWLNDGTNNKYIEMDDGSKMALTDMVDDFQLKEGDDPMTLTQYHNTYEKEITDFFKSNFGDLMDELTYQGQAVKTTSTTEQVGEPTIDSDSNIEELIKKYHLSDKEAETLRSIDLNATLAADGKPLYGIAKVPTDEFPWMDGQYVIVKRDGHGSNVDGHATTVNEYKKDKNGNVGHLCVSFKPGKSETVKTETKTSTTFKTTIEKLFRDVYQYDGVRNWTINQHDGVLDAAITAAGDQENNTIKINKCDNPDNCSKDNINIIGPHQDFIDTKTTSEDIFTTVETTQTTGKILTGKDTYKSPLILDMDGDGVVSAAAGLGVDNDGNGVADGAATKGDKMLAMTDLNGDGKIGGAEVFGDGTVSPFTKKPVNASNGFEALKIIAQQAKQYTGIDCMNGTSVDMKKLQQALNKYGVTLGFIGGANNTEIENLYGVASIDVGNYTTVKQTGDVQHRQQGSFTWFDGRTGKVNDVWFQQR